MFKKIGLTAWISVLCIAAAAQCLPDLPPVNPEYTLGGRTINVTNVSINGGANTAGMNPGETFNVTFDWTIGPNLTACPGCVTFFHFGLSNVSVPGSSSATTYPNTHCMGSVFPNQVSSSSGSFTAPAEPGFYYITLVSKWVFWCHQYAVNHCNSNIIALIQVGQPGTFQVVVDSVSHLSGCDTDDGSVGISVLNYTGCYSTNWTGPDGYNVNNQTVVSDLAAGEYEVVVSDISGCDTTIYITIDDVLSESVNLGSDTVLCAGETFTLNAGLPGASYLWQDGSTDSLFFVSQPGIYSVEVTSGNCTTEDEIEVMNQDVFVDLGQDTTQCGGMVSLDATTAGAGYTWQDGSSSPTLPATASGTYWVNVEVGRCTATDSVDIIIDTPFEVDLGPDTSICGGTLDLDATHPNSTYLWQDGSTAAVFSVLSSGLYAVEVVSGTCVSTDSVSVAVDIPQSIDLGMDTALCSGTLLLDASINGGSYLWQDGSVSASFLVDQPGTYSVVVSQGNSCPDLSDNIGVSYLSIPVLEVVPDTSFCSPFSYEVRPDASAGNILWPDGSTSPTRIFTAAGTYWVTLSNACGTVSDTFTISSQNCDCRLIAPTAFSPDRNGFNDFFKPFFTCEVDQFEMRIYNRWGEAVFTGGDINSGWDGSWKGSIQEMDVYTWIIQYAPAEGMEPGILMQESGSLLLFR